MKPGVTRSVKSEVLAVSQQRFPAVCSWLVLPHVFIMLVVGTPVSVWGLDVPPDGPEQMPVVYVKGYIDDGTGWARDALYLIEDNEAPISYKVARHYIWGPQNSAAQIFSRAGIPNWGLQWWSTNLDGGFARPDSTAEEGFAFLQTADELLAGTNWLLGTWTAQNRPIPSAMEILTTKHLDVNDLLLLPIELPLEQEIAKLTLAASLPITNTYNDAGRIAPRAKDFLELLRRERRPGGNLEHWRQINVITHSMGSLITRATLSLAEDASREDSEFVANVIYNAPPFGGSTMAYLGEFYFGPSEFTSAQFADPMFNRMWEESFGTAADAVTTASKFMDLQLQLLLRPIGFDVVQFKEQLPPFAEEALAVLENVPLGNFAGPVDLANTPVGDAIAFAMSVVRPILATLTGKDGRPGVSDLTPAGGIRHLTDYTTNSDVKQFVTIGRTGFGIQLFPPDAAAIAADPSIINQPGALVRQDDDTAVAVGSARLLTQTDTFGPRMDLLGEFTNSHPEMIYGLMRVMMPAWLETFLAAPTTLHLEGFAQAVDSQTRSYLVDSASRFSFRSRQVSRQIEIPPLPLLPGFSRTITVDAVSHQYRVVAVDLPDRPPSDWVDLAPGQRVNFGEVVATNQLQNIPFVLEWRSINARGGREMIRSARFVVAGDAPQVVNLTIQTPSQDEVHRNARNVLVSARAVRPETAALIAERFSVQNPLLEAIQARPEASWVVRDQSTKALTAVFDSVGSVEFGWGDPHFVAPTRRDGVNALVLPLADLPEGPNTLYFETIREITVGGSAVVRRGPRQQVHIQVDNTPPAIQFLGQVNHPTGRVVGPRTPLRFTVEDIGSNGGTGRMSVPGHPRSPISANRSFSLGETDLRDSMDLAGIVGLPVELTVTASDVVGNEIVETINVFYDIGPPEIEVTELVGALLVQPDSYVATLPEVTLAVAIDDAATGVLDPVVQIGSSSEASSGVRPLQSGFVAGRPNDFGATIPLAPGENIVVVSARDFGDNVCTRVLRIRYAPELSDLQPIDLLSPRLDLPAFFDPQGQPVRPIAGDIESVVSDYHGDVFAFASFGNQFVGGDTRGDDSNRDRDVFVWREGRISRGSSGPDGEQLDGDSDHPALSGNGRFLVFRSDAPEVVPEVVGGRFELYLKDLESGRVALISRATNGSPSNVGGADSYIGSALTFSGRYVFYASRATNLASGVSDLNNNLDIFVTDLDPDESGDYFDGPYLTRLLSVQDGDPSRAANGRSQLPSVTRDGRYLLFLSGANDIHPQAASNSLNVNNAVRLRFNGNETDGLDFGSPAVFPVNRAHAFSAPDPPTLTSSGVDRAKISPLNHVSLFSTRSNLVNSGDTNSQSLGRDVYLTLGGETSPYIAWTSRSTDSGQSSGTISTVVPVDIAEHLGDPNFWKVAWVSTHNNVQPDDGNNVADLFIRVNDDGSARDDLRVINWISNSLPSNAPVQRGGLTPDGRYAWWVSTQSYLAPYSTSGPANLFRRRLDPIQPTELTVQIVGSGAGLVRRSIEGTPLASNRFQYGDPDRLVLQAVPEPGSRFINWEGVDRTEGERAFVSMSRSRTVRAIFETAAPPSGATAVITTTENQPSTGVAPEVDVPGVQALSVRLVSNPAHGRAEVRNNLLFYSPRTDFHGADSFLFQVTNEFGQELAVPGTATVTVLPVNQAPVTALLYIAATMNSEEPARLPAVDDPDPGEAFGYTILSQPANGTVTVDTDGLGYTPNPGFVGSDTFTYIVRDSAGNSLSAIATVEVRHPLPADPGLLRSPGIADGRFRLPIQTEAGQEYLIEYKDSLNDPIWRHRARLIGSGGLDAFEETVPPARKRFFRVRATPLP